MSKPIIILDRVSKALGGRRIFEGLCWELREGECAVILGPSGGGKTVFLHLLLGLLAPDAGRIDSPGLPPGDRFGAIAVMFQEDALLDERTVEANLAVALEERADLFGPPFNPKTNEAIDTALEEVQLDPRRVRRLLPSALSGGMRRRVALARALIRRPRILIADEPTTGLDPASAAGVYDLLGELIRRHGMSAILITHDPACASRLGYPVYYFSPVQGRMPRWAGATEGAEPEARQRSLETWMRGEIEGHRLRQENADCGMQNAEYKPDIPQQITGEMPVPQRIFSTVSDGLETLGKSGLFLGRLSHAPSPRLLGMNLVAWGLKTLPLLGLIFLMVGIVIEVQSEAAILDYGFSNRLPEMVAFGLLRLAPILTGFLLAGRCGSAISAQTGWMQLSGQFRAMRTMRIEPERALFPPLFWALALSGPLLALAGLAIGGLGALALLASPLSKARITLSFFLQNYPAFLTPGELALVSAKGTLIGAGLAAIAFSAGARPKRSPADVTAAITGGLVIGFLWVAVVDTALSLMFPM